MKLPVVIVPAFLLVATVSRGAPVTHLRYCNRSIADIGEEATRRSSTFRELVADLEAAPIIVYARVARCPGDVDACLHFLHADEGTGIRTVRVSLGWRNAKPEYLAGLLAHELQHAREVASEPRVIDLASFQALFARLGWHTPRGYDTCPGSRLGSLVERQFLASPAIDPGPADTNHPR